MSSRLPIIAAIPNYNMASQLKRLLPLVLAQPYAAVYVLDDASTDDSQKVVTAFGKKVRFIAGKENICSGGNRNRILQALGAPAIIHFLDADTELVSLDSPAKISSLMQDDRIGLGGGLTWDTGGLQNMWNFGPRFSLYGTLTAGLHYRIESKLPIQWRVMSHRFLSHWLTEWPNIHRAPSPRKTFWIHESNMFIRSEVLAEVGGFDEHVRSHDIQDLAIRIQRAGYQTIFTPTVTVIQHNDVNVRLGNRRQAQKQAVRYIIRKNGWWSWLLPGGHLKPRYNK